MRPRPMMRPKRACRWAALLLAGGLGGGLSYWHWVGGPAGVPLSYEQRSNPKGTKSKVLLADGTTVWLNVDSKLWFPTAFNGPRREVYLEGEAFFDVKRNEQQPFIIHLGGNQVRVLGTSFNVKAYGDDAQVETAVVTGCVAFIGSAARAAARPDTVFVVPNQKVVLQKTTGELRTETVDAHDYGAWNQRSLVFAGTPLTEVARTLARNYNVTVRFANKDLRTCRLTGRFRNQSLAEVVRLVDLTGAFDFELHGSTLTIGGAGCGPATTDSTAPESPTPPASASAN